MAEVVAHPNIVDTCKPDTYEMLKTWYANIKKCEKALNEYLDDKKKCFPRFYFISNPNLLNILSNGNNPPVVCTFLGDCFDGFETIHFLPSPDPKIPPKTADYMLSKDHEHVEFFTTFEIKGQVESWLCDLEFKMKDTL